MISKIIYKPHCGNCGFPIDTSEYEITYQEIYKTCDEVMLTGKVGTNIYPNKCAHCGALFESIEIPYPKQLNDMYIK